MSGTPPATREGREPSGRRGPGSERGSAVVEAVLVVPIVVACLLLVVYLGRAAQAQAHVEHAAAHAARAASLARRSAAPDVARATAAQALAADGVACASVAVDAHLGEVAGLAAIEVEVRCTIAAADLAPLAPGVRTLRAHSAEVFDIHRGED